ncbi:MAG TPA: signal peptidase II [Alphaproteobacteria bacterium]|nr:signal peptidase II [Alphaproteobacteria bacterium]
MPWLWLAAAVAAVDQASKWLLIGWLGELGHAVRVTSFFNLVLVWNPGISFGMFQSGGAWRWVLSAGTAVIAAVLVLWLRRRPPALAATGIALVLGGAVGNLIDRLLPRRAVADFFDVHLLGYHWPAFNIADSAISVGVVLILMESVRRRPG